jgi:PEP-CTERM motif.
MSHRPPASGAPAVLIALLALAALPAHADLLAYEGFDYAPGTPLLNRTGGSGWEGGWNEFGLGSGTAATTAGLSYSGVSATGGAVQTPGGGTTIGHVRNLPAASAYGVPGTTIYFSVLLRPTDPVGTGPFGGYGGITIGDLFIGKPGSVSTTYGMERLGGGGFVSSGVQAVRNETALLVVRAMFTAGADRFDLYVNPDTSSGIEPATPNATKADMDVGLLPYHGFGTGAGWTVDEIRIATTYADALNATVAIPEPSTLALMALPLLGLAGGRWRAGRRARRDCGGR